MPRTPIKKPSGYTIVEVMIVLAIAGVLLTSALALFRGTSQRTQFEQAVNDFSSKLQASVKDISNELFPATQQYKCSSGPVLQQLVGSTQDQNTNPGCVYLGKLFHVIPGTNQMRIYTVVGNSTCTGTPPTCVAGQGKIPTNFSDSNPTIANFAVTGGDLSKDIMTETYKLSAANTNLVSAHANGDKTTEADFAGFYNGIGVDAQSSAQGGALNLQERAYDFDGKTYDSSLLKSCILNDVPPHSPRCLQAAPLSTWELCFADSNNPSLRALVTLTATSNAAQTSVRLKGC